MTTSTSPATRPTGVKRVRVYFPEGSKGSSEITKMPEFDLAKLMVAFLPPTLASLTRFRLDPVRRRALVLFRFTFRFVPEEVMVA
jgi:hypothetical protein